MQHRSGLRAVAKPRLPEDAEQEEEQAGSLKLLSLLCRAGAAQLPALKLCLLPPWSQRRADGVPPRKEPAA